ncbi:MAG: hypothetical protein HYX75_22545 [Acidobacteria bacterium]|nr:hypothetical protein [Acidobacteriota bacterium]
MTKILAQLDERSRSALSSVPEAGMGFYIVRARLRHNKAIDQVCVIGGDFLVVPQDHPDFVSISDLTPGTGFPTEPGVRVSAAITAPASLAAPASLPPGYIPSPGAIPLFVRVTLTARTLFYRFSGMAIDPCFDGRTLRRGTYLTTESDHGYANTGFAAVGRYALPLPVPASILFVYQLPAGTDLFVGTVMPNYGQAGGGVEARLRADAVPTWKTIIALPDY